jgi:hypothetical protein
MIKKKKVKMHAQCSKVIRSASQPWKTWCAHVLDIYVFPRYPWTYRGHVLAVLGWYNPSA